MIKNLYSRLLAASAMILVLYSCATKEDVIYLQDIKTNLSATAINYNTVIQKDDILKILVSSTDMKSVAIFNQNVFLTSSGDVILNNQPEEMGYLVDNAGDIVMVKVGKIAVAGKTIQQAKDIIKTEIEKYAIDPVVDIRIINFKISVLGEVASPGTFNLPDNRVTIPQAIGLAGDLTIFGNRKDIILLRDDNGIQKSYNIDLTNVDFINSETYFLKQNDILIVSPNDTKIQNSKLNQNANLYISIASLLLTATVIIINSSN